MTWWTLKAWPWLKKYWKWLLFPLGIIIFILGYSSRKKITVTSSELLGHAEEKKKLDDEAARQLGTARADRDVKLAGIQKEHEATVAKLTRKQRDEMEELREDPDKLNDFLLGVGKDIRGDEGEGASPFPHC